MRFDRDARGDWLVDPSDLACRLAITSKDLRRRMKLGLVTSRVERDSQEDDGRLRVTVRCGNVAWRGIFDETGCVISEGLLP
jgi:hypothetical protein